MAEAPNLVHVEIFGQTYAVRAGADASYVEQLARHVDEQMREVSRGSGAVDSVRIAVLAALNIADAYFQQKTGGNAGKSDLQDRAARLAEALDQVLEPPQ
jgi:cell division protein ZapA